MRRKLWAPGACLMLMVVFGGMEVLHSEAANGSRVRILFTTDTNGYLEPCG